jgi:GntR family transcriptional regulator, transcriptional repressor for pyruvate dehydrogenase complex
MDFESLGPRESAVDACAQAVRGAILRGEIAPGARLPPERQLAETLGVSRLTLRAGLAKVASTGLLSVKQGSGYRVQDFRRSGGPDLLPGLAELARRRGDLAAIAADLLRMRRHMARAVLERLAETGARQAGDGQRGETRGRDGADTRVGVAVEAFAQAVERGAGIDELAQVDLTVFAAILDETHSPVFALCLNPISAVVAGMPQLRQAMYAEPRGNVEGWRMLVAWLQHRRADLIDVIVSVLARRDAVTIAKLSERKKRTT